MATKINASFANNRNNGFASAKKASTAFEVGYFVTYDGSGHVKPVAAGTDKILGLSNEQITSASANYALTSDISISTPVNILDILTIPVETGTATTALVGTYVNVDAANAGAVDVSAAGTQILVTRVIDSKTILGAIALTVA